MWLLAACSFISVDSDDFVEHINHELTPSGSSLTTAPPPPPSHCKATLVSCHSHTAREPQGRRGVTLAPERAGAAPRQAAGAQQVLSERASRGSPPPPPPPPRLLCPHLSPVAALLGALPGGRRQPPEAPAARRRPPLESNSHARCWLRPARARKSLQHKSPQLAASTLFFPPLALSSVTSTQRVAHPTSSTDHFVEDLWRADAPTATANDHALAY